MKHLILSSILLTYLFFPTTTNLISQEKHKQYFVIYVKVSDAQFFMTLYGKYVKPYQDSLGDIIAWLHKQRNYDFANKLAITAVKKVFGENCNEKCLIFDRLWLSMFAILPKKYRIDWYPLQTTFLCWADNKTSKKG